MDVGERHAILTIKNAEKTDEGPYRLQLENELGQDSAVIKVDVNGKSRPRYTYYDGRCSFKINVFSYNNVV